MIMVLACELAHLKKKKQKKTRFDEFYFFVIKENNKEFMKTKLKRIIEYPERLVFCLFFLLFALLFGYYEISFWWIAGKKKKKIAKSNKTKVCECLRDENNVERVPFKFHTHTPTPILI